MKVLQFVEGGSRYGAAVSIRNLVVGLRGRDVDVHFCSFAGRPLSAEMRTMGFDASEIKVRSKFDIRAIRELRRIFRQFQIEIVHTHLSSATLNGTIAARISRIPSVSTVHGMNRRWTYSLSNQIITVSEAAKRHLVDQGVDASKVTVVYNGIPVPDIARLPDSGSAKIALGISLESPVFGTVSRAHLNKGILHAIEAARLLTESHPRSIYLFVGEGKHLSDMKEAATRLGVQDRVRFVGYQDDVFGGLRAMDVFVLPSLAEAMGISIVEAMAAERPIVATRVGGIPEVVTDSEGILVPPRDAKAIADACRALFDDPSRRLQLGRSARERVERLFTIPTSAEGVENVYRQVLARTSAQRA